MNSKFSSDILDIIRSYPFNDMSDLTKQYIHRMAERADNLEEELAVYREAFQSVGETQLKQAKRIARMRLGRMRHGKETGSDKGEQIILTVNGKRWHCPDCGSNVLTKFEDNQYICNGCQAKWFGE